MFTLALLVLASSSAFPLPAVDGKPLAVTEKQTSFRLPLRFERVRSFYDAQLKGASGVSLRSAGQPGERVLTIVNKNKADSWTAAKVTEREMETVIEVTPVLRMSETTVEGNAKPLVEFIISRSPDVDRAINEGIAKDHLEKIRQ